jgi:hypothetical protein
MPGELLMKSKFFDITGIFRVDEKQTLSSRCLKHSSRATHRATWGSIAIGRGGVGSKAINLNPKVFSDLPVIRRDDSWRSGNVVHNVCVEHDLQVLVTPVFEGLLYEFRE